MPAVTDDNRQELIAQFANWYVDSTDDLDVVMHLAEKQVLTWFDGMTNEQVMQEFADYEFQQDEEEGDE